MTKPAELPLDEVSLRRRLHEEIERMSGSRLTLLGRVVQKLEIEELGRELDRAFDEDRRRGALSNEKVQQVINQVRAEHPYGR